MVPPLEAVTDPLLLSLWILTCGEGSHVKGRVEPRGWRVRAWLSFFPPPRAPRGPGGVPGHRGRRADNVVAAAGADVEATSDGARAARVGRVGNEDALVTDDRGRPTLDDEAGDAATTETATVYVQPDRARIEFGRAPEAAVKAAEASNLRVQRAGEEPPQATVFVEDGAEAKRVLTVFAAVATA